MLQASEKAVENEASGETYRIKTLESIEDAKRIVDFFLSDHSFDDRNYTKGEIIQMKIMPYESLRYPDFQFWYAEDLENEIIGVISLRQNEQKTGGYFIDYLAVHKQNRKRGIALQLLNDVIQYVQTVKGRYIHAYTCDTYLYEGVRKLFEKTGFFQVGHLPDYYFENEGMIIYYKKM